MASGFADLFFRCFYASKDLQEAQGSVAKCLDYALARSILIEGNFIHQFLKSSEKRLARGLLGLSHVDPKSDASKLLTPAISQKKLAEMIRISRDRFFMRQFKRRVGH
jgi:hypothetical protein